MQLPAGDRGSGRQHPRVQLDSAVGIPVRLGIGDGSYTEVVSGDLRAGQEVITGILAPDRGSRRGPRLGF